MIYDRQGSAVTSLTPDEVDWGYLLDARVLHLTGITPALSEGCLAITREAINRAKANGVTVCFDLNYRSKLWSAEHARATLLPLVREVDILICGAGDVGTVFGVTGPPKTVLAELSALTKTAHVVLTRSSVGSCTFIKGEYVEAEARAAAVVDRLGAGDAYAAGVIDGSLDGDVVAGMRRGSLLSALTLAQRGDTVVTSRREMDRLTAGEALGMNR